MTLQHWIQCFSAFAGSLGFGIIFNIKGKLLFFDGIGGMLAWSVYLASAPFFSNDIGPYFIGAMAVSLYSECMAILYKTPVTMFLVTSLIPLVPGGMIYYTMQDLILGYAQKGLHRGILTFEIAGAIAMGILLMSFVVKVLRNAWKKYGPAKPKEKKQTEKEKAE